MDFIKGVYFRDFLKFLIFTKLPVGIQIAEIINAIIFKSSQVDAYFLLPSGCAHTCFE